LRRSTERKVVAGVAGGLGEYTGIDPVLFRVVFAVLTLFGGTGILLYLIGWLFLPAGDKLVSPAEALIGRTNVGSNRGRDAAIAVALVVAGLLLAGVVSRGDGGDVLLLVVVVGGGYYLFRNLADRRGGGPPPVVEPAPPPAPYQPYSPPPGTTATLIAPPVPAPVVVAPPPRRERSILGAVTLSALLVVLGITAALDAGGGADPAPEDYLALAVATLGAGLVVGALFGRARWLALLGLPAVVLMMVLSTSGVSLRGGLGDRVYTPTRAALVQDEYRLGVGSLRLDLSQVDFSGQLVRTKVSLGVGNIEIVVPPDTDVSIDGRAGAGQVILFDQTEDGTSVTREMVSYGRDSDEKIDLVLDLDVNLGEVRVDRAYA
jgi:phage shock protein PspC (stress-responsive transcriptional regulator)